MPNTKSQLKNWQRTTLGEYLDFYNGKSIKPATQGEYPVYGSNGRIGGSDESLYEHAVIIGRVGAYCGSVQYEEGKFWASDNTIIAKTKDEGGESFAYYLLENLDLNNYAGGAAQPLVTQSLLKQISVFIPTQEIQKQIADILSTYDNLIENNTKRIKIFEEIAQVIYKEWFVYFRFPGHEKVKMVDSKTEFGKIPMGWEVKKLEEFVDFVKGFEPGSDRYQEATQKGLMPFLRVGDLGSRQSDIFIDHKLAKGKILTKEDIAVSMDGTVGIVKIGIEGAYSSGIRKLVIKNDNLNQVFLWQLIQSENIQNTIKEHAKGTTILHASESIKYMKFVLPSQVVMQLFSNKVQSAMKLILNLEAQNQNWRQARDLLLPKLVTGEIRV